MIKVNLRDEMLEKRSFLSEKSWKSKSSKALDIFINSQIYKLSKNIMVFLSFKSEIDTHKLSKHILSDGKNLIVPITNKETKTIIPSLLKDFSQLEKGSYGILSPKDEYIDTIDIDKIDIVFTPGAVFSKAGHRIGYGGGYYDRFFTKLNSDTIKLGYCFDFQVMDKIPYEDHDIPVDRIITDKNMIDCNR